MQSVKSEETTALEIKRIRFSVAGKASGPVLIVFAGIHGNETAGVEAIDALADELEGKKINGSVYGITGNIRALEKGVRYIDTDLNRLWELFGTENDFSRKARPGNAAEFEESIEVKSAIESIIEKHRDHASDFIFVDLHTTSSESCAFILLNDTLANRELARCFPVPQILGIEENIFGTLLSYVNNLGHIAIGFEAGAHTNRDSVKRSRAFLWLLLHHTQICTLDEDDLHFYEQNLDAHPGVPDGYYHVKYHKHVEEPEKFDMIKGFENFDPVQKGTLLAKENGKEVRAAYSGRIFMPLYQNIGHDGYLIVREISAFWLKVSAYLRKSFIHNLLPWLPGVSKTGDHSFEINRKIARFLVKDIFHLLGYRVITKDSYTYICYRR